MDPITAGALVAANFAISVFSNKSQAKTEQAQIDLDVEQTKLQAEEQALEATKQFREFISYNAALSAMGFGGSTGFRGIAATSEENLNRDLKALGKQQRMANIAKDAGTAGVRSKEFVGNVKAGIDSVGLAQDLGLFKGGK